MKRDALIVVVTFLLTLVIFTPLLAVDSQGTRGLISVVMIWIVPVFVADDIAVDKERDGWPYALLLSWIGVLVVLFLPPRKLKSVAVAREDGAGQ